jgi:hypothetical protein
MKLSFVQNPWFLVRWNCVSQLHVKTLKVTFDVANSKDLGLMTW